MSNAYDGVTQYKEDNDQAGFLEALEHMSDNFFTLTDEQKMALRQVMADGRRMFALKED